MGKGRIKMKAVIFDMDGVLIDSQLYHYIADMETLKKFGVDKDEKFYESFAGTVTPERMKTLKNMFNIEASSEEMTEVRENMILDIIGKEDITPVRGIPELLKSIKDSGLKTAVASSSGYNLINMILERTGIDKYFDSVTSGEDAEHGKPAPDVFLLAARRLDVDPKDCIVIEDSGLGVRAAKAAGMKALGYINPTSGKQDLSPADMITDDFSKININSIIME